MFENERVIRILIKTRSCKKSDSATFMGLFSKKEGPKEYSSFQYKDLNIWYHQACASEKYGEKNIGRNLPPPSEPDGEFKKYVSKY